MRVAAGVRHNLYLSIFPAGIVKNRCVHYFKIWKYFNSKKFKKMPGCGKKEKYGWYRI